MDTGGLQIAICPAYTGSKRDRVTAQIPVSILMLLGLAMTICRWFPSVTLLWWQLALGMMGLNLILSLTELTKLGKTLLLLFLVLVLAGCLLAHKQVIAGLGSLGNDWMDALTRINGKIYLDFAVSAEGSAVWGLISLVTVCVTLFQFSIQTGSMLTFLPVMLVIYGALLAGMYPMDTGVALFGMGTILLMMYCSGSKAEGQGWHGAPTWMVMVLVCCMAAGGISWLTGDLHGNIDGWKQELHSLLHDQDTNSMPEGDLKNLSGWKKNDMPALEITMTKPQKMYLRGQVFDVYDGISWDPAEFESLTEYESLFYWLHQFDFYGQSQIGQASLLTGQEAPEQLTVKNLSACSAHGYYPYALGETVSLDADRIGDTVFPESEILSYYPGSLPQWYEAQHLLASGQYGGEISQYLTAEESYEDYVTQMDLQLTNESWSVLNRQLGQEAGPQSLSQICQFIRNWLEENLVYDENVKTLNGDLDFLQYTLEKSGSGYSVHYATAATLMLRYFGVPARYVEGYYLSAEEAVAYKADQPIILTEENAHAWAEYYLPGVGFVPFEVTPGYMDAEDLNLGGSKTQDQQQYSGDHMKYAQVEQPEKLEEPQQDRFHFSMKIIYLYYLLWLLLAALIVCILLRRKRFRVALKAIENASNRDAIAMRFGYAVALLNRCGGVEVEGMEQSEELNREALFSNHEMNAQQRLEMDAFAGRVLDACKGKWTRLEKLRYRFWDCLY